MSAGDEECGLAEELLDPLTLAFILFGFCGSHEAISPMRVKVRCGEQTARTAACPALFTAGSDMSPLPLSATLASASSSPFWIAALSCVCTLYDVSCS